ncbi:toxin extrusion protein 1 [Seminavis robusta]|uniref:Toxin extrusion protein 1 n=1 Tax=Seminavis robusta TaxID=568900 RepID=A0A9N8DVU5_9STRA|nr:toxin extrusion protein 1 [Seminavis robusta]|eukprot:Sro400_g135060.1 toxin extrusion protein 1 (494) ;mRNA; f:20591-22388
MAPTEETSLLAKSEYGKIVHVGGEQEPEFKCEHPPLQKDIHDTIYLAGPIFAAMLSWVGMKTTDTALLGHVSADALAAAALSDLWTMCTGVLIQGRILSVLCGAAVGANNPKLAGIYLQVSYFVLAGLCIVVFICWCLTGVVWKAFGSDPEIAEMAGFYAKVLALSIPGQLIFSQLSQFFQAQRIMYPEVNASLAALFLNLALGLIFVLGWPFPDYGGYGFPACPTVTTTVVYIQIIIFYVVYILIQKLHEPCWGGWSFKEITWERIKTFSDLYFPAAFGMASDFWRVAVVGAIAADLGELQVAVFNTSYRVMWICLVLVTALSSAAGIKMSQRLGDMDPNGAKQAGEVGIGLSFAVLLVIIIGVYFKTRMFGKIFTHDEEFLDIFESTRVPFCVTLFMMNFSVAIERIPYSMGRTKEVFWMGLVASWGAQVPGVYLLTTYWREDLFGLYTGMAIGYTVLALLYGYVCVTSDWKKYALIARQRSEVSDTPDVP